MITIDELCVGDSPDAWREIGFAVDGDVCTVGSVRIGLGGDGTGVTGWTLRGVADEITEIDGVVSRPASPAPHPPREPRQHPNGVARIDHLVLMTPDLSRTTAALKAVGMEPRRERDAGAFVQVFFRMGEVILELVGPKESGPGAAHLWGITFVAPDLDATATFLGDRIGRVKDAVQPGRRITTLRGETIGISPAVAFMDEGVEAKR